MVVEMAPLTAGAPDASPASQPANTAPWRKLIFAVLFAGYFFFVSWDSLKAPFAPDEMVAMYWYYHPTAWRLLFSQFMLWHGYIRPLGGVFYLPTFLLFGLNPVPFHAFLLILLLAGAYQMYRLARALGAGELASAMVALIACYHGGLSNLYYNSVFVFDVLCGLFYFAALAYYARIRGAGRQLSRGQIVICCLLYLCALNAKEMGVTLPAMLLIYEWLYHGLPSLRPKEVVAWLRGPGKMIFWAGVMTLVAIYGKALGPGGLARGGSAYLPAYSWDRFADFEQRHLGDIFYHLPSFDGTATLLIALAVTYLAWRRKRPILRFCWFYICLTPLPIVFLIGRDQACLYVTLAGWAIFAAVLVTDWLPSLARVAAEEPLFRWLGERRVYSLLAAAVMLAYAWTAWRHKVTEVAAAIPHLGPQTAAVLAEFRAANPQVRPGARVIFLNDPWPDTFDMAFIAELWFHDRTGRILLNQKTPQSPEDIAKADAVFDWREGKLIRVR
jgi:hypothetical protein